MRIVSRSLVLIPVICLSLAACDDAAAPPKAAVSSASPSSSAVAAPAKSAAPAASTVASAAPAAAPATIPAAPAGALALDSTASTVGFVGAKVTGKHEGKFGRVTGWGALDGEKAEGGKVAVSIDLSTVTSDDEKLTTHLKSPDFFDVAAYPTATFVSSEIKAGGEKGATHTVTGELDLHGVKKTISFPATIKVEKGVATATAEFTINRKDFKITYPGMPDNLIKDDVVIKLNLKAAKSG